MVDGVLSKVAIPLPSLMIEPVPEITPLIVYSLAALLKRVTAGATVPLVTIVVVPVALSSNRTASLFTNSTCPPGAGEKAKLGRIGLVIEPDCQMPLLTPLQVGTLFEFTTRSIEVPESTNVASMWLLASEKPLRPVKPSRVV